MFSNELLALEKENVKNAEEIYLKALKKVSLEEKEYKANFTLKLLLGESKVDKVIIRLEVDDYGLSPNIAFNCYLDNNFVGAFSFLEPSVILDKYDVSSIEETIDLVKNTKQYLLKNLNKALVNKLEIK